MFLVGLFQVVLERAARADEAAGAGGGGGGADGSLRYVLLNAASKFAAVLGEARAVIFASGTLSPLEALIHQLMPGTSPADVAHYSCGHVIGPDSLVTLAVGTAAPGKPPLDFRMESRTRNHQVNRNGGVLEEGPPQAAGGSHLLAAGESVPAW